MLKLRLRRTGKRNQPYYRIVVAEHTAPITGKFVAELGHYNPRSKVLVIDESAVMAWMNKGAEPSNTVARLLQKQGLKHKQIRIHTYAVRSSKSVKTEVAAETPVAPAAKVLAEATETPASDSVDMKEADVQETTTEPTETVKEDAESPSDDGTPNS